MSLSVLPVFDMKGKNDDIVVRDRLKTSVYKFYIFWININVWFVKIRYIPVHWEIMFYL